MESVTMEEGVAENQEECLGIQDQASGKVQVSMEAEVRHYHLLAKRRAAYRRRNKACTERENDEKRKLKQQGFLHAMYCNVFLVSLYERSITVITLTHGSNDCSLRRTQCASFPQDTFIFKSDPFLGLRFLVDI